MYEIIFPMILWCYDIANEVVLETRILIVAQYKELLRPT